MRLGIFAKTFSGSSPDVVLKQVKSAGYACAQYNLACSGLSSMPDVVEDDVIGEVKCAVETTGVELNALSATYNMIHPDIRTREVGHQKLAVVAKAAHDIGIPMVTLCTGTRDPNDQWTYHPDNASKSAWRDLIESIIVAIGIAERYDILLGIEPELANVISSAAVAKQLIEECQSPRLKIILDAANLFEVATIKEQHFIVSQAIDLLAPHIAMAHAKDRDARGSFVAAGTGVLDYQHFLSCLIASDFNGPLITHGLIVTEAPRVAEYLSEVLSPLLKKRLGIGASNK